MLTNLSVWQSYASQDHTVLTGWAPLPTATPVLPNALTSPQIWKYTTTTPTSDWTSASFNDSAWSSGTGGFGTAGTPGAIVNTTWNTPDIYLRKTFTMPAGSFSNLQIQAYHDEDMEVYINGVLAASTTGYDTTYDFFDIAPAALAQLSPGATVQFAVHCHQTVGGQDIDVGLVNIGASSSPGIARPGVMVTTLPPAPVISLSSLFRRAPWGKSSRSICCGMNEASCNERVFYFSQSSRSSRCNPQPPGRGRISSSSSPTIWDTPTPVASAEKSIRRISTRCARRRPIHQFLQRCPLLPHPRIAAHWSLSPSGRRRRNDRANIPSRVRRAA